jgi:hypothetical protein
MLIFTGWEAESGKAQFGSGLATSEQAASG